MHTDLFPLPNRLVGWNLRKRGFPILEKHQNALDGLQLTDPAVTLSSLVLLQSLSR